MAQFSDSKKSTFGPKEYLRWGWRQLTSMRVALMLLLLLAVATIPGSLIPQRGADPNGVIQYQHDHPELFRILDAFPIQAFDVYTSVWFSSIYLLLFVSLIGCVLPRIVQHWRAVRATPPRTPARLQRMVGYIELRLSKPESDSEERELFAQRAIQLAYTILKGQHYRAKLQHTIATSSAIPGEPAPHTNEFSVSAERGYLRETGNIVFHVALVAVLISVALGGLVSFNGQRVLVEGETLLNQLIDYDSSSHGRYFDPQKLERFTVSLDRFEVDYVAPGAGDEEVHGAGQVTEFRARVTLTHPDGTHTKDTIRVNHPLRVYGSPLYLTANGYAPSVTVRNADGSVVYQERIPFIPQDGNLTSLGVIKIPYGLEYHNQPTQLGLRGFFYPTKTELDTGALTSRYPDLTDPLLTLDVYVGDLGINQGALQSVYALDTDQMQQLTGRAVTGQSLKLAIGETVQLPEGMGSITLDEVPRYAVFDVMYNPTSRWVLISALAATAGLLCSLFVSRRRIWVKAVPTAQGLVIQYAGLARGEDPRLEQAVAQLRDRHRSLL